MHITTVVNQKGGVCKTTICRNLGWLLAHDYSKRVLLIDLDSSGNLSNFFGVRLPAGDDRGAAKVITDFHCNPADYIVPTRTEGLYVLPGNDMLGVAEASIKQDNFLPQQLRLQHQLKKIADYFDYCLIDCPPTVSNSILVLNALVASDDIIIPCVANRDSVDGVAAIKAMTENICGYFNEKLTIRGVLFCRIGRKSIDKQLVQSRLPVPRFRTYIREGGAVAEYSLFENLSFREYDSKAKAAMDMDNFAAEFLGEPFPFPAELPEELSEY